MTINSYIEAYRKNSKPVLFEGDKVLINLFKKLQETLVLADYYLVQNQPEKFAQTVGKSLQIVDVLCAGLNAPNDNNSSSMPPPSPTSPWSQYFAALVYTLNAANTSMDVQKIRQAQKSVETMSGLFEKASLSSENAS